jgi:tetratricopeptide (TPR) repeat protein
MISEDKKRVLDLFARGRMLYKLMLFDEAQKYFQQALDIDPVDGPSKVYLARCTHYIETPPAEDWDGVFVMTSK